eukprot:TRINITY_DN35956_c0_g1_i2.p1 TRINITY_DN35956_c0_g1~~TRINITY_DN35956_c0_g1_i2.p1  ORF type:complete len:209 (+),score=15.34 TRINITY_DN35956_c0_g1_i2:36-662(+)
MAGRTPSERATDPEAGGEKKPLLQEGGSDEQFGRTYTIGKSKTLTAKAQAETVAALPTAVRFTGVFFAFLTLVFIWESVEGVVGAVSKNEYIHLRIYGVLVIVSSIGLWVSHGAAHFEAAEAGTQLCISFLYALFTLLLAVSAWDLLATIVKIMVPAKYVLAVWLGGGCVWLSCAFLYSMYTQHNALLDVVSCAMALGFVDASVEGDY